MISRDKITIEEVINLGIEQGIYLDPDLFWSEEDTLFWYDNQWKINNNNCVGGSL